MRTIVRNAEQFDQHGVSQSSGFDFCLLATENSGVNSRSMSIAVDSTSVAAFMPRCGMKAPVAPLVKAEAKRVWTDWLRA